MTDAELEVIAKGFAPVIRELVAQEVSGLVARMLAIEQRAQVPGRDGRDGLPGAIGERGPQGEKGLDGQPGVAGKDGLDGASGKDGDPGAPGPSGERGADGLNGKDGAPGERGERGPEGPQGPLGKDGADGLNGKDGRDGADGKDGAPGPEGQKGLDGRDGLNGKDGADGITMDFDDLQAADYDGEKTVTLTFQRGDRVKTFPIVFSVPVYRDVYVEGKTYAAGDLVTWGGGMFIAKQSTSAKPGLPTEESRAWKLCVKAGRDGKEGKPGPQGEKGLDGRNGKDLTQLGPDGRKW